MKLSIPNIKQKSYITEIAFHFIDMNTCPGRKKYETDEKRTRPTSGLPLLTTHDEVDRKCG
jgi:hypothetical protein